MPVVGAGVATSVTLGIAENGNSIFLCNVLIRESLTSFRTL